MNEARKEYSEKCRQKNDEVLKEKYLLKYERDKHGRPVGVVVAFKKNGEVLVGWSRCHTKLEPFDKHIGINKALNRAVHHNLVDVVGEVPRPLLSYLLDIRERAERYFKVGVKPRLYVA